MSTNYCQACGTSMMPTLRMCPQCGGRVFSSTPPPRTATLSPSEVRGPGVGTPNRQAPNFDKSYGVYILAIDHPRKAFYVGIAAADSDQPEGVGSRIRTHRVKLTASNVGRTLACGTPAGVGGVHHPEKWRLFAVERYQHHLTNGVDDGCADVRVMVGTAGNNAWEILDQYERAILHNAGGCRSKIFDILWPGEDNSRVERLNTIRGHTPETLPGAIILPGNRPQSGSTADIGVRR